MTQSELLGRLRTRIGNPDKGEVSDLMLLEYVNAALVELADELKFRVLTETLAVALVAEQQDYPLPSDTLSLLWVAHNDKRLEPAGLTERDRDLDEWRTETSGTPTQFAVRGRRIYLLPKPGAAAVSEDGYLEWSRVATPAAMGAQGPEGLSDNDQWLLLWMSAIDWCVANPSEMNAARLPGYSVKREQMMARARERWLSEGAFTAKHHAPRLRPWTGGRMGGNR